DIEPHGPGRSYKIEQPVSGDMCERADRDARLEDGENGPHVDPGGAQQLLAEAAAELGDVRMHIELAAFDERLARQREAVRVQAAALQPEQDVARTNRGTREHPVECHRADRGPDQIEPAARNDAADHLANLRQLSTRAAHPRELAAPSDPFPEGAKYLRSGFLDRDLVHQPHV